MRLLHQPHEIKEICRSGWSEESLVAAIRQSVLSQLENAGILPDVSVIIPAFNEEAGILYTLLSLVRNITGFVCEIIVVNNNSADRTAELVRASGVSCIDELRPGITAARNAGLHAARGKIILSADADTIYPRQWIELMAAPLLNPFIGLTYGRFAFLPAAGKKRWIYALYEELAEISRTINRIFKDEAVNVYGFNAGFRRVDALLVNGYQHPDGSNEDGWLALKLRENGCGKIFKIRATKAIVWTTDRRLQQDGGLATAILLRVQRLFGAKPMPMRQDL